MVCLNFGFSASILAGVFFRGVTAFGLGLGIEMLSGQVVDTSFSAIGGEIAFNGMGWRAAS
jgi:hypothetical protein